MKKIAACDNGGYATDTTKVIKDKSSNHATGTIFKLTYRGPNNFCPCALNFGGLQECFLKIVFIVCLRNHWHNGSNHKIVSFP